ncbi:green heme protein [Thiocapsa imhoffii]|uniref:Green heme protein n=1 Tax=Thiocapsa imhoffii TaxID=382777 RepID=A0A9X0WIE7_9GAMM|nr:cytochrome c [Thiocapsa imhoffii]MBK1645331.1 green heme protein [Thiocapsa imhoffii]
MTHIQTLRITTLTALLTLPTLSAASSDDERAQALHEENCLSCHGSEVYTRADRMVTSYDGLERQVQRCDAMIGLRWFDEDINAVTAYLNHHFYQFER